MIRAALHYDGGYSDGRIIAHVLTDAGELEIPNLREWEVGGPLDGPEYADGTEIKNGNYCRREIDNKYVERQLRWNAEDDAIASRRREIAAQIDEFERIAARG